MLGQGEFAARLAKAIDDFDGNDVGGTNIFLALRHMTVDDAIKVEKVPQLPLCSKSEPIVSI